MGVVGCIDVGNVCLVSNQRPSSIMWKRGNRVIKCRNKTGRSCTERTPQWKQSGRTEVNLGRGLCVCEGERCWVTAAGVCFPLFFSFFYLSFQSSCPSLFSVFLPFLILRHETSRHHHDNTFVFFLHPPPPTQGFSSINFSLVSSKKAKYQST